MNELGPDTEIQQITKFVDDVNVETYEKPMMSSTTAWTRMAEDSKLHDIHAILQRPVNVREGEFNSAFTSVTLKFPDVILKKSTNVVKKLDYFTYFRANVKCKLVFNATPFMSGKYWMFFAPFDSISNRGSIIAALQNTTGFPGVEIDLASNAPVEIKIPYCAPLSHYNLIDTHSNMGELNIVPINAIQTGTTPVTNGATFTIFAWFEDIELAMPTSKPVTVPTVASDEEVWKAQVGGSEEHASTSGPPISGAANAVASAASMVGGALPILGKWLRPVEWVARAVGGAAEAVGWNKPTNLDKNCPYINVPAKGYTNADGIDLSTKLGAMPDNGLTYDGGIFSTDVDEMDLKYVASKSCIFKDDMVWDVTDAVGTVLHYNSVAPGMASGGPTSMQPTTLGFLTSMFRYWRGTLKYRLAIAKTAFHSGRLRITYHPGIYGDQANADNIPENAYNWILDLSVSSELEFEIPYVANVPWKETLVANVVDVNNWRKEKFSTGSITVTVVTQLRAATDSVSSTCPFSMWISGGDDIAFAVPDFGNYVIASYTAVTDQDNPDEEDSPASTWKAQVFNLTSKGVEHNEQVTNTASDTFPMSHMSPTGAEELCMGEKITSLRQLIKRFGITSRGQPYPYKEVQSSQWSYPGPIDLSNDDYLFNEVALDPCYFGQATGILVVTAQNESLPLGLALDGTITPADFTVANHYPTRCPLYYVSYLYRFFRGGRRYKMVNPATNGLKGTSFGFRAAVAADADRTEYKQAADSFEYDSVRVQDPMIVKRDWKIIENGAIDGPAVGTFVTTDSTPVFEHYVYPDLNGTIEFEVPYYGQMPISLVGENTIADTEGPLVRRARVRVRRSEDPRGMDRPLYDYLAGKATPVSPASIFPGGIRNCFGAYTLYEAAADDFSFGYLVGAPRITRVQNQP